MIFNVNTYIFSELQLHDNKNDDYCSNTPKELSSVGINNYNVDDLLLMCMCVQFLLSIWISPEIHMTHTKTTRKKQQREKRKKVG